MEFDLEQWLSRCGRAGDVLQTLYETIEFSKGEYAPFFQNCGLYVVGSSLGKEKSKDIDLVLVGLDFRAVADYDKIFLQDPQTLIDEEIVIRPDLARKMGVTNPFSCVISSSGAKSLWRPLPEAPGYENRLGENNASLIGSGALEAELLKPDRLEDLDDNLRFMLEGIEHKGEYWAYNFQKGMAGSTALNLTNYCLRQGSISQLVRDFHKQLASAFRQDDYSWHLTTPFEPYFHEAECYLTSRFGIHEEDCPSNSASSDKDCACKPIDFIIHSENLYVDSWKEHQKATNAPFAVLHQWPKVSQTYERPILTNMPYPEFIDPSGIKRVKPHKYFFDFLRTTPINVA